MSESDPSSKRRRIVRAPPPSDPRLRSVVLDVECAEDEDIEWHWTEAREGRFVSGYSLVPRPGGSARASAPLAPAIAGAKEEARESRLTDGGIDSWRHISEGSHVATGGTGRAPAKVSLS